MRKLVSIVFFSLALSLSAKPFTVVIDAGHGGKDPGAVGRVAREKDLNLDVALRLGHLIEENYTSEDVRVVYTRSTDIFIPLQGRADIVNKAGADLFICIHTNSAENRDVRGAETFVLGTEKMDKNLDVAMRENAVMKLESDYQTTYQGFDPNSVDSYIMFEMMQNNYMDQSLRYATYLQRHFSDTLRRADRGVRQAAFWVLLKSACPSVLVEMGFISNREEEQYLASEEGKQQMACAMLQSFQTFYHKPTKNGMVNAAPEEIKSDSTAVQTEPIEKNEAPVALFGVQILASKTPLKSSDSRLKGRTDYGVLELGGWYKYYIPAGETRASASELQKQLRAQFPDCYVISLK